MDYKKILSEIEHECEVKFSSVILHHTDEIYIKVEKKYFNGICLALHKKLNSPVMMFFASDETTEEKVFRLYCVFESTICRKWFFVVSDISEDIPEYKSLSKEIFSAALFEREMKEMFGLIPTDSPDTRRMRLHDEVWYEGNYPMRKKFTENNIKKSVFKKYVFKKVEGEGIFEVPVGPVHAGIIGPGHFRFSVAGEPIINLEIRLGFTHKGTEKLFENKKPEECLKLTESIVGDSPFAHSMAFCNAMEKMYSITVPVRAQYIRCIFLELERMYNHAADIGGIALDVGFSFPSAYASIIKEKILRLNEKLTGSRYIKNVNIIGGVAKNICESDSKSIIEYLENISADFKELKDMLLTNVSFLDRVETTGILKRKTAEDMGIVGLPARASGIQKDLRKDFPCPYDYVDFKIIKQSKGDVLARINLRIEEFEESVRMIKQFVKLLKAGEIKGKSSKESAPDFALGYVEGWRGPVLYWIKLNATGLIERCKIVDPSFHNWQGLSYVVIGSIIPDFPVCNKSFNLSYSGNDL